jgi:PAS domain S-box-containing protein
MKTNLDTNNVRKSDDSGAAEKTINPGEERLQALVTYARTILGIIQGRRFVYANPYMAEFSGYDIGEILSLDIAQLLSPEFKDVVLDRAARRQRGEDVPRDYEFAIIMKNGEKRWVNFSASVINYNGKPAIIGSGFDITKRKQAEEALRQSEEKFRGLATNTEAACVIIQGRRFVYVNDYITKLTGYSTSEILAMDFAELVHPDFRDMVVECARRRQAGEPVSEKYEFAMVTKKCETRWIDFSAGTIDYKGKPAIIGTGVDQTRHRRADQALRETTRTLNEKKAHFKMAIESAGISVWSYDPATDEISHIGRPPDWLQFISANHFPFGNALKIVHQDDREKLLNFFREALSGRPFNLEFRLLHPEGKVRWILTQGRLMAVKPGNPKIFGITQDITERKLAEEANSERQMNLEIVSKTGTRLLEKMNSDAIFIYLAHQLRQVAGKAFIAISENDAEANKTVVRSHAAPQDKLRHMEEIIERSLTGMTFTLTADARQRYANGKLNLVEGGLRTLAHNRIPLLHCRMIEQTLNVGEIYVMGFVIDETYFGTATVLTDRDEGLRNRNTIELLVNQARLALKRHRAEAGLIKADRDKHNFLAILGHELRNPLASISTSTDLLKCILKESAKEIEKTPLIAESLEIIARQTKNMKRLLDDLLNISRIISGKIILQKEKTDLTGVMHQAAVSVSPLVQTMRHELLVSADERLFVNGDPLWLEQVFVNLLNNAAKYTDPGGKIRLELRRNKSEAVIQVIDTGIGIDAEMLEHVFDPFRQADTQAARSKGGLGIGLTLVKNLVVMHNGTVDAQSPGLGKGSTFTVRLPLAQSENPEKNSPIIGDIILDDRGSD